MQSISPMGILKIGDLLWKAALEQTAKDVGVNIQQLPAIMLLDDDIAKRVKDYITSGSNVAISKL
jgi:hypothetical protein